MTREEHYKRVRSEPLYSFFSEQIIEIEAKIVGNSRELNKLTEEQIKLKRGRAELIKLRKQLD